MSDSNDFSGGWAKARRKINEGKNHRDTVSIPMGDETVDLTYRLLTESEVLKIESAIDRKKLLEHRNEEESDEERRLRELQEKEDLTDQEERELQNVSEAVQLQQAGIMDSLGYDTFKAFMAAGARAITPSEADIDDAFNLDVEEQERRFGKVPETRSVMTEKLEQEMRDVIDDSPYMIKFTLGQTAYGESLKLMGDVDESDLVDDEGNHE